MDINAARSNMIQRQIQPAGVTDSAILDALERIPREYFTPDNFQDLAYAEMAIRVDEQHTMLPPRLQAMIIQAAHIKPTDRLAVINTASGYLAALTSHLAQSVDSYSLCDEITAQANQRFASLNLHNAKAKTLNPDKPNKPNKPYHTIIINGALIDLPKINPSHLENNGMLIGVFGQSPCRQLIQLRIDANRQWHQHVLTETDAPTIASGLLTLFH